MSMSKIKIATVCYVVVLLLSLVFLVNAIIGYRQSNQNVNIANMQLKAQQSSLKAATQQQQDYETVTKQDIRNTADLQALGDRFINDMFNRLKHKTISDQASQFATKDVTSAFLGATFGGDVDEGQPSIKLEKTDLNYSKDANGLGVGFGTITYKQNNQTLTLTILMQIQDGKINQLQTGKVRDTSGSGSND